MRGICWMAPNAAPYTAAIITVVTIVVRRNRGANSSPKLGRLSVPSRLRCSHCGDSGRNGRMMHQREGRRQPGHQRVAPGFVPAHARQEAIRPLLTIQ